MTMSRDGRDKLSEESGEVLQVIGKLNAFPGGVHPDGGPNLFLRLEDEIADVLAACSLVARTHGLDIERMEKRYTAKLTLFNLWHDDPNH